ncbi:hypothetical protein H5P28_06600 [Ruficoccus amylovorans]|uniref:Uncharacterized protein n=1 Tax=Ruficoccus amylovorans TaxID=1804625 RepID=A0A842HCY3_9BACT|nr:hypothetical protein [Ruficoccus amylovorans]MBC2593928.1 hypothetical protein [Ruficoccus amylovorans]
MFILILLVLAFSGCASEEGASEDYPDPIPGGRPIRTSTGEQGTFYPARELGALSNRSVVDDGIFAIVPPAQVNPRNVEVAPDPQIITIDFQKGFQRLPAVVTVDGEKIFSGLLRSNADGFADTTSFRYKEPPVKFTLEFPTMNVRETFSVDPDKGRFVGISIVGGRLRIELKETGEFVYGD